MEIKFTKDQFKKLLKIVYLGNWLANAIHSGRKGDERIKEFDEIEQYIFSFAKDFGLEKYVEFDEKFQEFFPTSELEEELQKFVDEYDNEVFWEELIFRLTRRDFIREYGKEAINKMSLEERIEKEFPFEEKYREEFSKNGIENLDI